MTCAPPTDDTGADSPDEEVLEAVVSDPVVVEDVDVDSLLVGSVVVVPVVVVLVGAGSLEFGSVVDDPVVVVVVEPVDVGSLEVDSVAAVVPDPLVDELVGADSLEVGSVVVDPVVVEPVDVGSLEVGDSVVVVFMDVGSLEVDDSVAVVLVGAGSFVEVGSVVDDPVVPDPLVDELVGAGSLEVGSDDAVVSGPVVAGTVAVDSAESGPNGVVEIALAAVDSPKSWLSNALVAARAAVLLLLRSVAPWFSMKRRAACARGRRRLRMQCEARAERLAATRGRHMRLALVPNAALAVSANRVKAIVASAIAIARIEVRPTVGCPLSAMVSPCSVSRGVLARQRMERAFGPSGVPAATRSRKRLTVTWRLQ